MTPPRSIADAPLHERLEAMAGWIERGVELPFGVDATLREAAAALLPPEGEVGALCERLELLAMNAEVLAAVTKNGLLRHMREQEAADLRSALAHLRRLAKVEAALREIEALANDHRDGWLETRHTDDGDQYGLAIDEGLKWEAIGALARALAPAPVAEGE